MSSYLENLKESRLLLEATGKPKVESNLGEKWEKDVEIQSTGEHADKSVAQLKKEIASLRGKPGNKEKMGELLFALRAKQGWKKKTGL